MVDVPTLILGFQPTLWVWLANILAVVVGGAKEHLSKYQQYGLQKFKTVQYRRQKKANWYSYNGGGCFSVEIYTFGRTEKKQRLHHTFNPWCDLRTSKRHTSGIQRRRSPIKSQICGSFAYQDRLVCS